MPNNVAGGAQWEEAPGVIPAGRLPVRVYLAIDPVSGRLYETDVAGPILDRDTGAGTLAPSDDTALPAGRSAFIIDRIVSYG